MTTQGIEIPSFAEPHVHADHAFSLLLTGPNPSGLLADAVERFQGSIGRMTADTLAPGCLRLLRMLAAAGVWHVRAHTAIGGPLGFRAWEAVERAASLVPEMQVRQVAMPVTPDADRPDVAAWLREAAARGAVAVGGAPWLAEDPAAATRASAELAAETGIGLDLHVDETDDPAVDTVPALVETVTANGLAGRAVAAHCCSMATRAQDIIAREATSLAMAGVAVVVCPVTNLSLQGRFSGMRGIAPITVLRRAGVRLGIGLDNVRDVIASAGTADPLRAAWLLALVGHLTQEDDLAWLGEVITEGNRRICEVGDCQGPRIRLDAESLAEAVALVPNRSPVPRPAVVDRPRNRTAVSAVRQSTRSPRVTGRDGPDGKST